MKSEMNRLSSSVLFVPVFLFAAGLGDMFLANEAAAQIRPAYTRNVDDPGRQPYDTYIEFTKFGCVVNCINFLNSNPIYAFDGPVVPTGKRLVIKHVSGRLPNTSTAGISVALQSSRSASLENVKWSFFGPFFDSFSMAGFSAETFATYGPGERPHFNVLLPTVNASTGYVSISGYLIDAN